MKENEAPNTEKKQEQNDVIGIAEEILRQYAAAFEELAK